MTHDLPYWEWTPGHSVLIVQSSGFPSRAAERKRKPSPRPDRYNSHQPDSRRLVSVDRGRDEHVSANLPPRDKSTITVPLRLYSQTVPGRWSAQHITAVRTAVRPDGEDVKTSPKVWWTGCPGGGHFWSGMALSRRHVSRTAILLLVICVTVENQEGVNTDNGLAYL